MQNTKVRALCEGAIMVALSFALSFLKIDLWFQGGSVDLVMVPLIVFAVRWGLGWGFGASLVFGTLKYFFAAGFALNWVSIIFDYSLAYAVVGLAGLFFHKKNGVIYGALLGGCARFIVHFISGVTVYAEWMPETFMGMNMTNTFVYSLLYNGGYMLPNIVIAVAVGLLLAKSPLKRYLAGSDLPAVRKA